MTVMNLSRFYRLQSGSLLQICRESYKLRSGNLPPSAYHLARRYESSIHDNPGAGRSRSTKNPILQELGPPTQGVIPEEILRPSRLAARILQQAYDAPKPVTPVPLTLKRIGESYLEGFLLFKSDPDVREDYVNQYNGIRLGKVLEDLDAFSGAIAYRHCQSPPLQEGGEVRLPNVAIVTASVDRIDLLSRPTIDVDFKLSGMVTYVGHSSMGITITMESVDENLEPLEKVLVARFSMVARDPDTQKAAQVNPLIIEDEKDNALFRAASEFKERKRAEASVDLKRNPPSSVERILIHDLYLESQHPPKAPRQSVSSTKCESAEICYPQDRNIHNFVFGGRLMKRAFELAYICGTLFCQRRPYLLGMDDITFKRPVPIGSILRYQANVVYATERSFVIKVQANLTEPEGGKEETTNVFNFTFTSAPGDMDFTPNDHLRRILPATYGESIQYLDGKRRWERAIHAAREAKSNLIDEF